MARGIMASDEGRASKRQRKKVEMLFAHLKRILKPDRLRLRGPCGLATSSISQLPLKTSGRWPS